VARKLPVSPGLKAVFICNDVPRADACRNLLKRPEATRFVVAPPFSGRPFVGVNLFSLPALAEVARAPMRFIAIAMSRAPPWDGQHSAEKRHTIGPPTSTSSSGTGPPPG